MYHFMYMYVHVHVCPINHVQCTECTHVHVHVCDLLQTATHMEEVHGIRMEDTEHRVLIHPCLQLLRNKAAQVTNCALQLDLHVQCTCTHIAHMHMKYSRTNCLCR